MKTTYQWIVRGGGVTAALGAILLLLSATGPQPGEQQPVRAAAPIVRVTEVSIAANGGVFLFPARVRSTEQAAIAFTVGGRIEERVVRNGETVAAGQLLARIDDEPYRISLQNALALVAQAEVERAQLVRDLDRARRLGSAVTAEENEQRATAVAAVDARLRSAQAGARAAERALEETRLTAPFDAVVTGILADAGSVVSPGSPVVSLSSRTRWVETEVRAPFSFVMSLSIGSAVSITAPDGFEVEGRVVAVAAHSDAGTGLFPVTVVIENPPPGLVSGVSVDVALVATVPPDAVRVPTSAVATANGGDSVVVVIRDRTVHRVPVRTVGATHEGLLVTGELSAGESVVVGGRFGLADGDQVEVRR
ncbi:MAG: efflux RND transporter periplasmic adaptor subunit [Spirochaetaceae bacterium]|nr:MAG: efflux RND transporter periplasmic adaptor subunit [Spirochaetaceae bacterium]